jgi:2-methylisocitrate lyase-like PEP mutase family enzyme
MDAADLRSRFRAMHEQPGIFVLPNPWDVGSARLLASLGFEALATTSAGFAWSLGRLDQQVSRDELVDHVAALSAATDLPLNVDSERCFAEDPEGVAETVRLLAGAGAAGCSIEDYDPATRSIEPLEVSVERVVAAAGAAHEPGAGLVLTARCERHLYGADDVSETIERLVAYVEAGADCVYAPGLVDLAEIRRVVDTVGVPVNVLLVPDGPSVAALGEVGVRRASTGGSLARAALGALVAGARELLDGGTSRYVEGAASREDLAAAFG